MKRSVILALLILLASVAFSQQPAQLPIYNQRVLEVLGLSAEEIREILLIQEDATVNIRRHQADQEIKKAELARLLLDEEPSIRMIERNLRATASIEVDIRMIEIQREIAIRQIVGTDRWAQIVRALRERRVQAAAEIAGEAWRQFQHLLQAIAEKQTEITDLLQDNRDTIQEEDVRRLFQELGRQSQELQRLMRERLQ